MHCYAIQIERRKISIFQFYIMLVCKQTLRLLRSIFNMLCASLITYFLLRRKFILIFTFFFDWNRIIQTHWIHDIETLELLWEYDFFFCCCFCTRINNLEKYSHNDQAKNEEHEKYEKSFVGKEIVKIRENDWQFMIIIERGKRRDRHSSRCQNLRYSQ